MAYTFVSGKHLKGLLNDVETVHKRDVHTYTAGHLNDMHLHQAASSLNRKSWSSAQTGQRSAVQPVRPIEKTRVRRKPDSPMKEALYEFSMGTTGSVQYPSPQGKSCRSPTKRWAKSTDASYGKYRSSGDDRSVYSELDDGILVEELHTQDLMMPAVDGSPRTFLKLPLTGRVKLKHMFVPLQSRGITKEDQYNSMQDFEANVLRKNDAMGKDILLGTQAVEHHEKKLKRELAAYHLSGIGPNFHKLQVYSDIFEDLIQDSPTFSYILGCIKVAYDNYITKLLDSQTAQHHLLQEQVDQMALRGTSRPKDLQFIVDKLDSLEELAKEELNTNNRLRDEVREETEWLANCPEQEPVQSTVVRMVEEAEPDLADEIEHIKALILEKLDVLNALRTELKDNCVPLTVCTHLEQCIKETEIEVQKLLKQNEYYERSIAEMDHDLKAAIVDADTSEKDAKRIWRKVNSTRGLPGVNAKSAQAESDDDEEESKWNWYIS
ncbi:uncharacterized protein LOC121371913 [Gigantopelta aegis]|uniref:uncharacterized protein LOC121371913 n=1 Tax=Gigantopelta aegis TaxID=1735272 RepID=UPI001B888336|nr:uncharacterized protein LOC121371913 [Gigantopelta aegis]